MKFKVGDRVRVVRESLSHSAKVGMTGLIVVKTGKCFGVRFDNAFTGGNSLYGECEDGHGQWLPGYCIEPIGDNHKIVITSDGKTTLARLCEGKKVVKSAEANCSPDDEFDFTKGARIAFERLTNTFKVGDKIIGNEKANRYVITKKGWIGTVKQVFLDHIVAVDEDDAAFTLDPDCFDLYVEPKYYSGKLVCVKSDYRWWTAGKVYEFVNGKVFDDECTERERILDVADMNDKMYGCARFIELKE